MRGTIVLLAFLTGTSFPVHLRAQSIGPSFNCARAKQQIEKLICGHRYLSWLDRTLAELYRRTRAGLSEPDRRSLLAAQRDWIAKRNSECAKSKAGSVANQRLCLIDAYNARHLAIARLGDQKTTVILGHYFFRKKGFGGDFRITRAPNGQYRVHGESFSRVSRSGANCGINEEGGQLENGSLIWILKDDAGKRTVCRITFTGEIARVIGCDVGCGVGSTMSGSWTRVSRPYKPR